MGTFSSSSAVCLTIMALALVSCTEPSQPTSFEAGSARVARRASIAPGTYMTDPAGAASSVLSKPSGGTTAANPVITYTSSTALEVMNSDGSNQTAFYTPPRGESAGTPTWAPASNAIAFFTQSSSVHSLKTTSVSVDSRGRVVATTPSTIFTTQADHYNDLMYASWSSTATTNKIAFILQNRVTDTGLSSKLCIISPAGGTPTVLATGCMTSFWAPNVIWYHWPTWSPDDSKIAVVREWDVYAQDATTGQYTGSVSKTYKIMIFDVATGSAVDSIDAPSVLSSATCQWLQWSRSGSNLIAFRGNYAGGTALYYVSPTTGATPSTNGVSVGTFQWSPDNRRLILENGGLYSLSAGTSNATTILNRFGGKVNDWHR